MTGAIKICDLSSSRVGRDMWRTISLHLPNDKRSILRFTLLMKKLCLVCASSGKNLELSKTIQAEAEKKGFGVQLLDLTELPLPLYTPKAQEAGIPDAITQLLGDLKTTESFGFLVPEYNGGLPPTVTNFLAWASVATKDWRESFNHKTAFIGTHSGSGGLHALMALRTQLAYIGMTVLGRQLHTHYSKQLNEEALEDILSAL